MLIKERVRKNIYWIISLIIWLMLAVFPMISRAAEPEKRETVVTVGYFEDDTFHVGQSDDAIKKGYGYEYYSMVSNYTGWKYKYYYGTWSEVYEAFLRGEIDIIDNMSITEERKKLMDFSTLPMGEEHYYIFVPEMDESIVITDINSLDGKRIGVEANSINKILLEQFLKEAGLNCKVVPCLGINEIMERIYAGKLDAMVNTDAFSMDGYRATFVLGNSSFYFAVRRDRQDLLQQLNYAMNHIHENNPNYANQLANKYLKKAITRSTLSNVEYQYLKTHPLIKMGYRKNSFPFAGQNSETGEMIGLIRDVCNRLERILHIAIQTVPYNDNNEMIEALNNGEINCAYPVMDNVWLSEQLGYTQTNALSTEQMVLIYKGIYRGKNGYKKFGYVKGSPDQRVYLIQNEMDEDLIAYKSDKDAIDAIQRGLVDGMVMNSIAWSYYSNNFPGCDGLYSVPLDEEIGYSIAIPKDEIYLFSSLNAAISQLDNSMILDSLNRNAQVRRDYSLKSFVIYNQLTVVLMIIILCLAVILAFIYYRQNRTQKKQLYYEANHDSLTGVHNRSILAEIEKRMKSEVCLAIIDIDNFKTVNDIYGHERGDEVIRLVAQVLKDNTRSSDVIVRFGGDEFLIIMEGITRAHQAIISDKFNYARNSLKALADASENLPSITLSVGIAFSTEGYCQDLFDRADVALYKSKEAGKDRFTFSEI